MYSLCLCLCLSIYDIWSLLTLHIFLFSFHQLLINIFSLSLSVSLLLFNEPIRVFYVTPTMKVGEAFIAIYNKNLPAVACVDFNKRFLGEISPYNLRVCITFYMTMYI